MDLTQCDTEERHRTVEALLDNTAGQHYKPRIWMLLYQIQATVGQCKIAVSNTDNIELEVHCIKYKQQVKGQ